jgi:hypothetical protein
VPALLTWTQDIAKFWGRADDRDALHPDRRPPVTRGHRGPPPLEPSSGGQLEGGPYSPGVYGKDGEGTETDREEA